LLFAGLVTHAPAGSRRLLLKVSGELFGVTDTEGNPTKFKVDNSFFKQGFAGASFIIELGDDVTDTNILIMVVDPQGNPVREWFDFDMVTRVDVSETRKRFFATGLGVEGVDDPVLGAVDFSDAVLSGTVEFTTNGLPRLVTAELNCIGDADGTDIILKGKANGNNPFIAAPTNFNKSATSSP
jgi:hypothetical protein